MTATEAELVRAIANDLDDEAAWAVYADWLGDRGDPRGELIQLEAALAELDEDDDERRRELKRRVTALLDAHGDSWIARQRALGLTGIKWEIRRGVVGEVRGAPRALAKHAATIIANAPLATHVSISVPSEARELTPLADNPLLERARSIRIYAISRLRPTGWDALSRLPAVRALSLETLALGPADLESLLGAPALPTLTSLKLEMCQLNRGAIEPFAHARCPLTRLDLGAHHLGARLGEIVGDRFRTLEVLRIPGNDLGRAGLEALLPALANVVELDLRGAALTADDLRLLFRPRVLPKVRALMLGGNELGDEGAAMLASWNGARKLRKLQISNAGVTNRGAKLLARSKHLAKIAILTIAGSSFEDATDALLRRSLPTTRIFSGDRFLAGKLVAPAKRER